MSRPSDHRNLNLAQFNIDVLRGKAGSKIIWQPRIGCWYHDKKFLNQVLPDPFTGMSLQQVYSELGCSNRLYEYNDCFKKILDPRVKEYSRQINALETEHVMETPMGRLTCVVAANTSNYGAFPRKWWITSEEDVKVAMWIEEHCEWKWNQDHYNKTKIIWGDIGAPTIFMPRVNIQHLFIDMMGVEEAIYALYDYPDTIEDYFKVVGESHERMIQVINASPIDIINFGDNLHCGTLPPYLFEKYVLPAYIRRNELLHKAGKFTHAHWDGDTKALLPYAKECGLDGIEAITPKPQGDVTLEEVKEAFGDELFLFDGIAAILFDDTYPEEMLIEQTNKVIELFAPRLVLGISDEISSTGNIERIRLVGKIVDDYNAKISKP